MDVADETHVYAECVPGHVDAWGALTFGLECCNSDREHTEIVVLTAGEE